MRKYLLLILFLQGCTTVEEDDRLCIEWDSTIEVVEECIPMYGNIICVTKEKPRYWCTLYMEPLEYE